MQELRSLLNMKIYVDTDDDVRLARRWGKTAACQQCLRVSSASPGLLDDVLQLLLLLSFRCCC